MAYRIKQKDRKWFIKDVGRGNFRLNTGKRVKPNERFLAYEEDIPHTFRNLIHKLDGTDWGADNAETEEQEAAVVEQQPQYYKQERFDAQGNKTGWWDVYDPDGNPVNESAKREQQAEEMVQSLNAS